MSMMKRVLDAIRINPGFRISGIPGALEIENVAERTRQFLMVGGGAKVETRPQGDDGELVVVLSAAGSVIDVSAPMPPVDARAWSVAVSREVRRALGGRGAVWPWVLVTLVILWFVVGVLARFAGMAPPAVMAGAASGAPPVSIPAALQPGATGLPNNMTPEQYWQQELAKAQDEIDARNAARAAAGIGAEVCEAPADMAATADSGPSMGAAPPITGFEGESPSGTSKNIPLP